MREALLIPGGTTLVGNAFISNRVFVSDIVLESIYYPALSIGSGKRRIVEKHDRVCVLGPTGYAAVSLVVWLNC